MPLINLVWRHMAAYEGVLEWAWDALEPAFASGALAVAATRTTRAIATTAPMLERIPDAEALIAARTVLAVYNHSNPINLIALRVLVQLLAGSEPSGADRPAPTPTPAPPRLQAQELPAFAIEIDDATAHRMKVLARLINGSESALMPTVLRHLAHWSELLDALQGPTEILVSSGAVETQAARLLEHATEEAASMPVGANGGNRPAREITRSLEGTIETFSPSIARMVVIGHALASAIAAVAGDR